MPRNAQVVKQKTQMMTQTIQVRTPITPVMPRNAPVVKQKAPIMTQTIQVRTLMTPVMTQMALVQTQTPVMTINVLYMLVSSTIKF
jgi:hypothetical protein